jgi:hypothetical protein
MYPHDDLRALANDHRLVTERLARLRSQIEDDIARQTVGLDLLKKEELETMLQATDPIIRAKSLFVLEKREGARNLVNTCISLAASDPDSEVRSAAVMIFGDAYKNSMDVEAGRFLAQIVTNGEESIQVRRCGYKALLTVAGGPVLSNKWPRNMEFDVEREVDWDYIKTWLSGQPISGATD